MEPGVHQYIPIQISIDASDNENEFKYYWVNVAHRADDVIVERSNVNWREMDGLRYWTKRVNSPVVLPTQSIEGKHLWWNRQCNMLLISGELHTRLKSLRIDSGLKFQKQIVE